MSVFPHCSCGTVQELQKFEEEQKLTQLVMGLNDSYSTVRANFLMKRLLPSMRQVYSLLIQEEKQREICSNSQLFSEAISLNVGSTKGGHCNRNLVPLSFKNKLYAKKQIFFM